MSLKLAARLVTFPGYKILDLKENDTTAHDSDVSDFVGEGCVALILKAALIAGGGSLLHLPCGASAHTQHISQNSMTIAPIIDRIFTWKNSQANDEWDVILFGYFTQKRTG